jgi:diguanylate cyclase (GGDEF)-like protein/PAS domain S-box-containing protein
MNQVVILAALPSVACLCLGLIAFISSRGHESGKIYSLLCLNVFFLSLLYLYFALLPFTIHDPLFFAGLAAGWALLPAILFHFSIRTSSEHKKPGWIIKVLIYLPVAAFLYRGLEHKLFSPGINTGLLGWTLGAELNELWRWAYIIYFSMYCAASALLLLRVIKRYPRRSGGVISFLAAAGVVPVIGLVAASDLVFPGLAKDYNTTAGLLVMFIWLASLWAAIKRPEIISLSRLSLEHVSEEAIRHGNAPPAAEFPELTIAKQPPEKDKPLANDFSQAGDACFRDLVEHALVGIFINRDGKLIYVNRKMAEIFGYLQEEISGSLHILELVDEADRKIVADNIARVLSGRTKGPHFTFGGRRKDGVILDIEAQCTISEFNGEQTVIGSLHEITERKMMEEAMRHAALHDPLTSLPNRVLFSDRVDMAISKAGREKAMAAVMFLDLDRFKNVNDAFGHNVGDMLLQSAAGVLRGCLRDSDSVARLGGDEFTILLSSINHQEDAIKVARKILSAVNQKWNLAGHNLHLTTSVGISLYPDDGVDSETLIRKADTAMYSAKAHGGNTMRLYAPFMDAGNAEQMRIENDLRMALDKEELFILYQPQFDMLTRRISGVEALLRWNHPKLGIILPDDFIPIAEKTGLIVRIGEWVLKTSCVQAGKWHDKGYSLLHLAVNVSGIQLKENDFADMVEGVLKQTSFESSRLKLEITESVALQNLEAIVPKLTRLTDLGVQFAIDDFGMGYSSLNYLKRLPIQTIKIDRSFMRDLAKGEEDASIVTAIIAMAKSLKLDTVAEGVETSEQMVFLNKCHCDKMQGFLYSQPLYPGAFESLLR